MYGGPPKGKVRYAAFNFLHILERSCIDIFHKGIRKNGVYQVVNSDGITLKVFCDFESETDSVWTLVTSFSLRNKGQFHRAFYYDDRKNEQSPNWNNYRYKKLKFLLWHLHTVNDFKISFHTTITAPNVPVACEASISW